MNPIKFSVFVFFTMLAPFVASTQLSTVSFPFPYDDAEFSYLSYWATPLSGSDQDVTGFIPVILMNRPVIVRMPGKYACGDRRKYRITEEGNYEYYYGEEENIPKPKQGFKPITVRTFYLEAARNGIISPDIKYGEFIRMTADEQRVLLGHEESANRQTGHFEYVEANLIYRTSPDGYQAIVSNGIIEMELNYTLSAPDDNSEEVSIKYLPSLRAPSQLVKLLTDPLNNYRLTAHARYKNINDVFEDISTKLAQD